MSFSLIALVALALVYSYLTGVHDASTLVSSMISSRALDGRTALLLTAAAMFVGPFVLGVAVATTIGSQVVDSSAVKIEMILAALLSAVAWEGITWFLGIPSSASHALVGGLVGAVWAGASLDAIHLGGLLKVLIALFASP